MNARLLGFLVILLAVPGTWPALAWSKLGDGIICEIAFQELNDRGRKRTTEQLCAQGL